MKIRITKIIKNSEEKMIKTATNHHGIGNALFWRHQNIKKKNK